MKARIWIEHLADNEWGNELMRKVAMERFEKDPSLDIVEVNEHAGWSLSYTKTGMIVGSANDMAEYPPETKKWCKQFTGSEIVGYNRRNPEYGVDHKYDGYYPVLACVEAA